MTLMDEAELDWGAAAGKGDGTGRILPKNGEKWNNKH